MSEVNLEQISNETVSTLPEGQKVLFIRHSSQRCSNYSALGTVVGFDQDESGLWLHLESVTQQPQTPQPGNLEDAARIARILDDASENHPTMAYNLSAAPVQAGVGHQPSVIAVYRLL